MKTLTAALLICLSFTACKSKKNTTTTTTTNNTENSRIVNPGNSRFTISFFSPGDGIDLDTKQKFDEFLKAQPVNLKYDEKKWGREGEVDYCFSLSELNATEQAEFIKKAKEILSKSQKVHVNENVACAH